MAKFRLRDRLTQALRFARTEALVLVALAVCAGSVSTFIELTEDAVYEGDSHAFDQAVLDSLRTPGAPHDPIGPAWVEEMIRDITALGSIAVLAILALTVVGFLLIQKRWQRSLFLVACLGSGVAISQALKQLFERERPAEVYRAVEVMNSSYPSGHAMLAGVTYLTLGALLARAFPKRRFRIYVLGVAMVLTLLVGLSRIYLGVHWVSDVLAGWSVGAAWATACWLASHAWERLYRFRSAGSPP